MALKRLTILLLSGLLSGLLAIFSINVLAAEPNAEDEQQIRVIALFKNAAMVNYAGKQKLYRAGKNISPEIKLIKADTHSATFLMNGEKVELGLDRARGYSSTNFVNSSKENTPAATQKVARIVRNNQGHFVTGGFINGVAVQFLVDTGATTIAMSESVAKLVGLSYKMDGVRSYASTAGGNVTIWNVTLKKVRVGGVELTNVNAGVIKGGGMREVLLGMSFLNRIKMEYDGPLLTLTKKY